MKTGRSSITIIGDVCIDLVMGPVAPWPQTGTETIVDKNELRPGGSAGNSAMAIHTLGGDCHLISLIGNDDFGHMLNQKLSYINTTLQICDSATTVTAGIIHDCSERTFFTTRGHLEKLEYRHVKQALQRLPHSGDLALLSGVFLTPLLRQKYQELIALLKAQNYEIAIDIGWPSQGWSEELRQEVFGWLSKCDHILLNQAEIKNLANEEDLDLAIKSVASKVQSSTSIIVKAGSEGAIGFQDGLKATSNAKTIEAFDTIGAGDSFNAGYLLSRSKGGSLPDALSAGCDGAATIISEFPRKHLTTERGQHSPMAASAI